MVLHLNELLTTGQVDEAVAVVKRQPHYLEAVMEILSQPDAKINVRVGIGVIMEELEGSDSLRARVEQLGALSQHEAAAVRADACHYLGLSRDSNAARFLRMRLEDDNAEVREIAAESLEML
jgi:HEAT repeat protein